VLLTIARRTLAVLLVISALVAVPASTASALAPQPNPPDDGADWLTVANYYRSLLGASPLVEDGALSQGAFEHARYMSESGHFAHDQDVPSPFQTPAGARAAAHGNLYGSDGVLSRSREAIDAWADSLAHSLWMLAPTTRTVGYGQYVRQGAPLTSSAVLDVLSAPRAPQPTAPLVLPRAGSTVSRGTFPTAEQGALAPCGGLPDDGSLPVFYVYLPAPPVGAPQVSLVRDGAPVPTCSYTGDTYTNPDAAAADTDRSILSSNNAVIVVPSEPLRPSSSYSLDVTVGAQHAASSFSVASADGYWVTTATGDVHPFGDATSHGSAATSGIVDMESTPTGGGYWLLERTGAVLPFGDAVDYGQASGSLDAISLSTTPSGRGYWLVFADGTVFAFGDAGFFGDPSSVPLNGPIIDSVATSTGRGYYLVASDGGVFTYGDAAFHGSTGNLRLNKPVRGLVPAAGNEGYWLVAADGGVFSFGPPFRGSMGGAPLNKPIVGMVRYGSGYLMVGADGGIFNFSDKPFSGSLGDHPPSSPIVAVAVLH
jgi:hypothetical protein